MSIKLFTNIHQLVNTREEIKLLKGKELSVMPIIENAWIKLEDNIISGYGPMKELGNISGQWSSEMIDARQASVLPCWCDSHTHLVFAGDRQEEFIGKIKGLSYAEINARGGGILNSAKKLNETPETELFQTGWKRLEEISRLGTGAIEIKSGYGLTVEGELKMLRVIKKLKEKSDLSIKSTFLGAHSYPQEFRENHEGYVDLIVREMLPVIASEKLADYIDVFCENGFFSPKDTEIICKAGMGYGLKPKLHVNQLNSIGGIEMGIHLNALSLDHLETLSEKEIQFLSGQFPGMPWNGLCTLLPTAAFFLGTPFPPARQLIDAGSAVTIASDFNPGSSPSGNMNLVIAMSCIQMKMLPEEALNAATLNGAYAMGLEKELGSITVGKKANLIFTKPISSIGNLPYFFGSNLVDKVMIEGKFVS